MEDGGWGQLSQRAQEKDKPTVAHKADSVVLERKKTGSHTSVGNRFFKFKESDVRAARMIKSSVIQSYAEGSIINLVSVPKAGKTSFAMQETMTASVLGGKSLYVFNESPKWSFMRVIKKNMDALGYNEKDISNIYFLDMVDESLSIAQYKAIEEYMVRTWVGKIKMWLSQVSNPQFIVIDSFSEIVRKYVPQAYHAMKYFSDELNSVMYELKKFPVVLLVNQKSGGTAERFDETVLGGYGMVHKTDGSILLRLREISRFEADRYRIPDGSILHTIQIVEMREMDSDTNEYVLIRKNGVLRLGPSLGELKRLADEGISGGADERQSAWGNWVAGRDVE